MGGSEQAEVTRAVVANDESKRKQESEDDKRRWTGVAVTTDVDWSCIEEREQSPDLGQSLTVSTQSVVTDLCRRVSLSSVSDSGPNGNATGRTVWSNRPMVPRLTISIPSIQQTSRKKKKKERGRASPGEGYKKSFWPEMVTVR
jgi:hypothetical protein